MTMEMIKKTMALSFGLVLMGSTATFAQSLDDAKKAIDAEQYQKATGMLKQLVASKAKDGENHYWLGRVYLANDELDSARAAFTAGTTADPKNGLNYAGLAHVDVASGNQANAKTNIDKALEIGRKDYQTYLAAGRAYLSVKNVDTNLVGPILRKAEELDAKDRAPETFIALGDMYVAVKDNTKAYPMYLRALDIDQGLNRVHVQIAKMNKEAFAFAEAETELKKVTAADPNYGPAYGEMGELYMQWSYFDPKNGVAKRSEALEAKKKYISLTDDSFDSKLRYAEFLVYAQDWPQLEQEVAKLNAPQGSPKEFIVLRMKGYSQIENKNYAEGLKTMDALFARTQDASRVIGSDYMYLGLAQSHVGNDSLAAPSLIKAVQLDSTKADTLANLAKKFYDAGVTEKSGKKFETAGDLYGVAIKANSKSKDIGTNAYYWGNSYYFAYAYLDRDKKNPPTGLLLKADTAFAKLAQLAPEFETAYLSRARVNKLLDNKLNGERLQGLPVPFYEEYVKLVTVTKPEKAEKAKRGLIEAYNNLGAYALLNDVAKAREFFNKTLALDPNNPTAHQNIKVASALTGPTQK